MRTKESIEATCPDCRGPLSVVKTESLVEISCLVGHTYSPDGLLIAHSEAQEKALWAAMVSLKEAANIVDAIGDQLSSERLERLRSQIVKKQEQAAILQAILEELEPFEISASPIDH